MLSILVPNAQEPKIFQMLMEIENLFPGAQVVIATDRDRRGKGWAIREALSMSEFDIVCFLDGDMDIHPKMIRRLLPFLDEYDIVVGKKQIRGLISRRILTFLSRFYILALFGLNFDTQTGIKIFKAHTIFPWESDSFAFDIEILDKAKRAGYKIIEVPVETDITRKMKGSSILKCFTESMKIWIGRLR